MGEVGIQIVGGCSVSGRYQGNSYPLQMRDCAMKEFRFCFAFLVALAFFSFTQYASAHDGAWDTMNYPLPFLTLAPTWTWRTIPIPILSRAGPR